MPLISSTPRCTTVRTRSRCRSPIRATWGRRVKDAGLHLICQVQTFADVDLALAVGADVLVAQGTEAGGHTGTMTLLPLLCGIAEQHPDVPLLAAGGIADGRGLAAALVAGADGAWLGTAFLATTEAVEIGAAHKDAIVASDGGDTVFTRAYDIVSGLPWPTGIGERVRRDSFTDEWAEREAELAAGARDVEAPQPFLYGQSARFVNAVQPAARGGGADQQHCRADAPGAPRAAVGSAHGLRPVAAGGGASWNRTSDLILIRDAL